MRLRRALGSLFALSLTACGDLIPELPDVPEAGPGADAGFDSGQDEPGPGDAAANDGGGGGAKARTRVVSMAPTYVLAGDTYTYRPKTSTKGRSFALMSPPAGMRMNAGRMEWTPTAEQAGTHRVTMRVLDEHGVAEEGADQEIKVSVATSTLRAEGDVSEETGGNVVASNPSATRFQGVGAMVSPGSVRGTTRLSVSELDEAPPAPNAVGTVRAVRFGPAGQVFDTPARVSLPLPEDVVPARARLGAYVYDPKGRWQRVPVLSVDTDNRLVMARAPHFSVYAALQSALDLDVALARAGRDSACEGVLLARVALNAVSSPLSEVKLDSVNNLPESLRALVVGDAPSVQDLLGVPSFSGSLRMVQLFELVEAEGEVVREQRALATTLYVPGDGTATVTHADALGNVLAVKHYPQPLLELEDLARRLRGAATAARFDALDEGLGLGARLHLAYFPGDASSDPVNVDDLGLAAVERAPVYELGAEPAGDADCDGLLDAFDGSDDRLLAGIEASPHAVVSAISGDWVTLSARVLRGGQAAGSWSLIDGADATLAEVPDAPHARRFSAGAAGRYLVAFRAQVGERSLEHVFAIDVVERPQQNTPPRCQPSKEVETGRVGHALALQAIARDDETPTSALRIEWGLLDPSGESPALTPAGTLVARGDRALFSPLNAGNYVIGCRAFDGASYGPIGALRLSMVAADHNRPPTELTLTPLAATIRSGQSLRLRAWAHDPDGDAISFAWQVEGEASSEQPVSDGGESSLRITAGEGGMIKVVVSVTDGKTPPVHAVAQVLVGDPPAGNIDMDRDGWPAGQGAAADCDDANPEVHPGAFDRCGDEIDADCDGSAQREDCDYDGVTAQAGDCDDANPLRHPQAHDLCDGIDNDCDQAVDENYAVGQACLVGQGACEARGVFECSADGLFALCSVSPLLPREEVCDGADNNCNGAIDEPPACGSSDAGVSEPSEAGMDAGYDAGVPGEAGTGGTSMPPDAAVACMPREYCQDKIDNDCDGFVDGQDVDCQGACVPDGAEDCYDQRDNDCDGLFDGADPECCVYEGVEICQDRRDNDCDGMLDAADPECSAPTFAQAESCQMPEPIEVGFWRGGTFSEAKNDIESSCARGLVDRVYRFTMAVSGEVMVRYSGPPPFAWSIHTGECTPERQSLHELACKGAEPTYVPAGVHFLVLEGETGPYEFVLEPAGADAGASKAGTSAL